MFSFISPIDLPLLVVDACQVPVDDGVVGAEVQGAQVGGHSPATRKKVIVGWYV